MALWRHLTGPAGTEGRDQRREARSYEAGCSTMAGNRTVNVDPWL